MLSKSALSASNNNTCHCRTIRTISQIFKKNVLIVLDRAHGEKSHPPLIEDTELLHTVKATENCDDSDDGDPAKNGTPGHAVASTSNGDGADPGGSVVAEDSEGYRTSEHNCHQTDGSEDVLSEMERLELEKVNKQYAAAAAAAGVADDEESDDSSEDAVDERGTFDNGWFYERTFNSYL